MIYIYSILTVFDVEFMYSHRIVLHILFDQFNDYFYTYKQG